jgi:hypothetical protein
LTAVNHEDAGNRPTLSRFKSPEVGTRPVSRRRGLQERPGPPRVGDAMTPVAFCARPARGGIDATATVTQRLVRSWMGNDSQGLGAACAARGIAAFP